MVRFHYARKFSAPVNLPEHSLRVPPSTNFSMDNFSAPEIFPLPFMLRKIFCYNGNAAYLIYIYGAILAGKLKDIKHKYTMPKLLGNRNYQMKVA